MFTKSGIMVGFGEERNEVLQLMDDLRSAEVDFLTIGQYLQPTRKHHPVVRFVPPDEFKGYETTAYAKGFLLVSATPLTRSSHHAGDDFAKLKSGPRSPSSGADGARMPSFRTTRPVRHTPQQMFDLVADVERYPEFLPLCEGLRVRRRAESGEGVESARRRDEGRLQEDPRDLHAPRHARPHAAAHPRRVCRRAVQLSSRTAGASAPLRRGCEVEFYITYEFKSFALGLLMGAVFDKAFRSFVEAFEERADEIYGRSHAARA